MYVLPLPAEKFPGWPKTSFGVQRSSSHVHQGVDLFAPKGTPVLAVSDGVVTSARTSLGPSNGKKTGAGRNVVIEHAGGIWSWYMHLDTVKVTQGQTVKAGQQIGTLGNTMFNDITMKSPAHLHFEILDKYPPGGEPKGGGIQHRLNPQTFLEKQGAGGVSTQASGKSSNTGVVIIAILGAVLLWKGSRK